MVDWTDAKNERRCLLIDKKHDAGLARDEQQELERLQGELAHYQRAMAPRPLDILQTIEVTFHIAASPPNNVE